MGRGETQVVGQRKVTGGAQLVTSLTMAHLDRGVWPLRHRLHYSGN